MASSNVVVMSLRHVAASECVEDRRANGVGWQRAVDGNEYSALAVEVEERTGVAVEHLKPAFDHGGVGVVGSTGFGALRETRASHLVGHVEENDRVGLETRALCALV